MKRNYTGSSNYSSSSKKPRRLPGYGSDDNDEGEGSDYNQAGANTTGEDDDGYDCSPPGNCGPEQQSQEDLLDGIINPATAAPPCIKLPCKPCPYWEREIVKYNPDGKWDPKVKEKRGTGRPDLGGEDSRTNSKKKNNRSDCNESNGNKFVALGEPCNAYRCYLDPCVPPGHVYCTLKHFKPARDETCICPRRFPMRPDRIAMCPAEENAQTASQVAGADAKVEINFTFRAENQAAWAVDQCDGQGAAHAYATSPMGQADDPCYSGYFGNGNAEQAMQADPCLPLTPNPGAVSGMSATGAMPGSSRKRGIPEEWIMKLPPCNNQDEDVPKRRKRNPKKWKK